MKQLILMRHAKSSWESSALIDHERPLNARGRHDAPVIGHYLWQKGVKPDLIISSDSLRTRQTVEHLGPFTQGVEYYLHP